MHLILFKRIQKEEANIDHFMRKSIKSSLPCRVLLRVTSAFREYRSLLCQSGSPLCESMNSDAFMNFITIRRHLLTRSNDETRITFNDSPTATLFGVFASSSSPR